MAAPAIRLRADHRDGRGDREPRARRCQPQYRRRIWRHLQQVQNLTGSTFDDKLTGDIDNSIIIGNAGNDRLDGHGYLRGDNAFFHGQGHAAAINDDGTADCENGQRGYMNGNLNVFGASKNSPGHPGHGDLRPAYPGQPGPDASGRPRVPAGETFSRENEIGPRLAPEQTTRIYSGSNLTGR